MALMILNRQNRIRVSLFPLEKFLNRVRRELHLEGRGVSVCLISDREIARMNRRFRGKRGPTDVLSFPANGKSGRRETKAAARQGRVRPGRASGNGNVSGDTQMASYLGDIAISPQTARRNARRLGRSLDYELRVLMLHGVLHLMGYEHETDEGEMDRLESRLRRRLGLT